MKVIMSVMAVMALLASPTLALNTEVTVDSLKVHPVTKVITLLKDMLTQLEKESEEDQAIYDKLVCWCETNDRDKTKAIADAEQRIEDLTSTIEECDATSVRLQTEIKATEKEVAANQAALDKATSIRMKELGDFQGEEKDLLDSLTALKSALNVLSKHNAAAFIQIPQSHMLGVAASVQHEMQKHASLLKGVLTHKDRRALASFIQSPQDYFDAEPTFKQNYPPQSGEIFGILGSMKDTFEANLSDSQKEELAKQKSYEELKAAKDAEIKAGNDAIEMKTQELAANDQKNADSKEDLKDTKASLAADDEFLAKLKEQCATIDKEFDERTKTRQLEMEACSKALGVMSDDDAQELFTKNFNFAQLKAQQKVSSMRSNRRAQASKLLAATASKLRSPRLATIAAAVKLNAFTKVKKTIDDMVAALLKEKADEIKHKDFCVEEFNKNQMDTETKDREKAAKEARIADLEVTIKDLTEAIGTLKAEVAEMQNQFKRAGEDREKENKAFQETVADQRQTQRLLESALKFLQGFYDKNALKLLQKQTPPASFKDYSNNKNAGGVMGMIKQIVSDAHAEEMETIRSEEDAQKAYEDFVKETNSGITTKSNDIIDKSSDKGKGETDLVQTTEEKDSAITALEELATAKQALHDSCDFVMKNFEIRQTARDEEVEALKEAKAILSGAKFEEFLQIQ